MVVATDPNFVPTAEQRGAAHRFFKEVTPPPNANGDWKVYEYAKPRLFGAGEALEAATCPACAARIEFFEDEGDEWWSATQEKIAAAQGDWLPTLTVTMPCCDAEVKVADLRFHEPAYFARFGMGVREPSYEYRFWKDEDPHNEPVELTRETLDRFQALLGCPVRTMWSIG